MPSTSYLAKQMIVMRRDLKMRKGKIAAQAGHACVEAVLMALAREGRGADLRASDGWAWIEHAEDDVTPL
ncbi:MAG TPA: peptidyl-tRNA hydrolase, partial [Candidatus Olsenella stercoravium]|nr:peptidyl-tRNA hydrolase [Candidatus Olsenella stercoravium]